MPKYSHRCIDCACITETEYSIKDEPQIPCEVCQGPTRRIIQVTAIKLEGGGWFKDGYDTAHRKQQPPKGYKGDA